MKKNKTLIFICLVLSIIGFVPSVSAVTNSVVKYKAYNWGSTKLNEKVEYSYCGNGSTDPSVNCPASTGTGVYEFYNQFINMGGKNFKAWCIDPALNSFPETPYTCTPYTDDAGIKYIFEEAVKHLDGNGQIDSAENEILFTFAFRFYSVYAGIGMQALDRYGNTVVHNSLNSQKEAMIRYMKYRINNSEIVNTFSNGNATQFLPNYEDIIDQAYELAYRARVIYGATPSTTTSHDTNESLKYTRIDYDTTKVVYKVNAGFYIDPSEIQFLCASGSNKGSCSNVEYTWEGNSGIVTVYTNCLTDGDSAFGIVARFKHSGIYSCYAGEGNQLLLTLVDEPSDADLLFTDHNPACGNPDCCNLDPINPGEINGVVANCCVETTHSYAKDWDLDELFCYHAGLQVDKYWAKCDADYYISEDFELNDYCDLYCTERVTIDVPEAITAKSGRYFSLSKNPVGNTTSPYIEGYKRCRILIKYDQWEKDYIKTVREQVRIYNEYQKQMSFVESYNQLIRDGVKIDDVTATVKCSATAKADDCTPVTTPTRPGGLTRPTITSQPQLTGGGENTNNLDDETCKISYKKHIVNTARQLKPYYLAAISGDSGGETINNHGSIIVSNNRILREAYFKSEMPSDYVITEVDTSKCDSIVTNNQKQTYTYTTTQGCSSPAVKYSCTIEWEDSSHKYDIEADKTPYVTEANRLASQLQVAITSAKTLENQLKTCNDFFVNTNKDSVYKFDPTMTFKYSQIYRDDHGNSVLDEITIPFMSTPGCKVYEAETGNLAYEGGMDTSTPHYSNIYGSNRISIIDFARVKFVKDINDFNSILDTNYETDKKFTHDARYKVVCEWEEEPNNVNTLVPNGAVSETSTANFTVHEREYKVYLTTYDGTFETDWSITNVGENGKFDSFLQNTGKYTCSGEDPSDEETFSCTLHVGYEIVYTGKCNGITKNPDDCDPVDAVDGLFQFKVADPTNLFPTGTTSDAGEEYAKNWTDTSTGITAKEEIEERGARGETYAQERETYKFHLTPSVMRHIKNYNVTRNSNQRGGYSDFEMNCDCPTDVQTNTAINGGVGCTKCKSTLLNDLVNGRIRYDGQTYQVSVWTSNKSLDQVRNETWR